MDELVSSNSNKERAAHSGEQPLELVAGLSRWLGKSLEASFKKWNECLWAVLIYSSLLSSLLGSVCGFCFS